MKNVMIDSPQQLEKNVFFKANSNIIGSFWPVTWDNDGALLPLDNYDKVMFENVSLKPGEHIFRYETETTKAGNIRPLIKINIDSGRVYFLVDDPQDIRFETKGVKTDYLRIVETAI